MAPLNLYLLLLVVGYLLWTGKRCPDVPGNGDKDQISLPDVIRAETGPTFALPSSASAMLSTDWIWGVLYLVFMDSLLSGILNF